MAFARSHVKDDATLALQAKTPAGDFACEAPGRQDLVDTRRDQLDEASPGFVRPTEDGPKVVVGGFMGLVDECAECQKDSGRQPSGGSIGAIVGPCIERNCRAWSSFVNSIDDGFEYRKAPRRQADAGSDYDTVIALRG